jgi:hypothetical protein
VLSRAIARLCLLPEAEHEALMPAILRLASRLGLPREEFVAICERIGRSWGEWGRLLQMNTGACPRFEALGKVEETTQACASPDSAGRMPFQGRARLCWCAMRLSASSCGRG